MVVITSLTHHWMVVYFSMSMHTGQARPQSFEQLERGTTILGDINDAVLNSRDIHEQASVTTPMQELIRLCHRIEDTRTETIFFERRVAHRDTQHVSHRDTSPPKRHTSPADIHVSAIPWISSHNSTPPTQHLLVPTAQSISAKIGSDRWDIASRTSTVLSRHDSKNQGHDRRAKVLGLLFNQTPRFSRGRGHFRCRAQRQRRIFHMYFRI